MSSILNAVASYIPDLGDPNVPETELEQSAAVKHPLGAHLEEMDVEAFFNMRDWLKKAVEAQGAKMTGGGIGMGQADIDVDLDGYRYNISIRPLPTAKVGSR